VRYRATLAYDGTRFHGFQRQANASPTVQGELEAALSRIGAPEARIIGAGRTDAGVHATGQVIAFDMTWAHPAIDLQDALNANLPPDIAVREVRLAGEGFHPRYDALKRTYEYELYVAPVREPLRIHRAWHIKNAIDAEAATTAAMSLLGEHDFSAFGSPPQGINPVRIVYEAAWSADREGTHRFRITANAFLYRMVRSIVGTLVPVGQGRVPVDTVAEILASRERSRAGMTAPAHGLTLMQVCYPE
jgi:tRNA pseudouridine38-40 synthase